MASTMRAAPPRVHGGVGQAHLGRDGDFAGELGEELGADRVDPALAVHDVLELGMSGHRGLRSGRARDAPATTGDLDGRLIEPAGPKAKSALLPALRGGEGL